ncbi:MAG: bifunctional hydroxymethylpyrimidine kinase/phosphomethylpyrimidine kinase, partial [Candidatus Hydrogenedentota bacterium]
ADLKTYTALKVYGMSAITAITAQNTQSVTDIHYVPAETVAKQIDAVIDDIGVDAVKSGMLSNVAVVEAVADRISAHAVEGYILDPVMISETGHRLLQEDAMDALKTKLIPLALLITPNIAEAEALGCGTIQTIADMEDAAKRLFDLGPGYVLVKGGHMSGDQAIDILYDGIQCYPFAGPRIATPNTHGTGCTYGAAITAYFAKGFDLSEAIGKAKFFLHNALQQGLDLGHGPGPLDHMWNIDQS